MGALFVWPASTPGKSPKVGDRRVVTRFLMWPKVLDGEWRWLGFVDIEQEFQSYRVQPPEMRVMDVVGWRSVSWARGFREGSQLANVKRPGHNGPPPCPKPPPPPSPPRAIR